MNELARDWVVRPLAGAIGAEVAGVDLLAMTAAAGRRVLRGLWLTHGVLVFPGQRISPPDLVAVARSFGPPVAYPFLRGLPEAPEVIEVTKREDERHNFGGLWHSDTAYLAAPPMATLLIAREVPPAGGDTLFASGAAAYQALSPAMRRMLDGLRAVNSSAKADVTRTREDRVRDAGSSAAREVFEATHPVVRTHPETGARALYVNLGHTVRFEGMTEAESAPLLAFLFEHQARPEFTCRVSWQPGTLTLWDNRCVLHNPINDYHGHRRVMHRVTLAGEIPH